MQVSILGPVEVIRDGRPVAVGGARVRALLTRLALAGGRPVTSAGLIDAVWGDVDSDDPANALQSLVSRLRRALGQPGAVIQVPGGYRLDVRPSDVDAHRFDTLVAAGRADLREERFDAAEAKLAEALGLWRGPALADLPDAPDASALEETRTAAAEDRLEAEIGRGRAGRSGRATGIGRGRRSPARTGHRPAHGRVGRRRPRRRSTRRLRAHPGRAGRRARCRSRARAHRTPPPHPAGRPGPVRRETVSTGGRVGAAAHQPAGHADQLRRTRNRSGRGRGSPGREPAGHLGRAGWRRQDPAGLGGRPGVDPAFSRRDLDHRAGRGQRSGRRRRGRHRHARRAGGSAVRPADRGGPRGHQRPAQPVGPAVRRAGRSAAAADPRQLRARSGRRGRAGRLPAHPFRGPAHSDHEPRIPCRSGGIPLPGAALGPGHGRRGGAVVPGPGPGHPSVRDR